MSIKYFSRKNLVIPGRRQALRMMTSAAIGAAAFDPIQALIGALVDGAMNQAQAAGVPDSKQPRNYLYVAFPGAPNRYHWDLPLAPYSGLSDPNYTYPTASLNPALATRFKGSSVTPEYGTTVVTAPNSGVKLRMPQIWSWTIPTTGGTWIPMAALLDHMIFIRGLISLDGHVDSQTIQLRPTAGAPSVDGAVADRSHRPVPALALGGSTNHAFASATGAGNLRIEDLSVQSNPLQQILTPFDRNPDGLPAQYLSRREAMSAAMSRAMDALGAAANSKTPGADALWSNRKTAEDLIRKGIGDVSSVYSQLLLKYQTLVSLCANEHKLGNAAGVTDRNLSKSQFASAGYYTNGSFNPLGDTLQSVFQYEAGRPDRSSNLIGLPESFAIAEYLLVNGYSSTIIAGCGGVNGLGVPGLNVWGWDEHGAGAAISVVINSMAFRAVAACLNELTQRLQAANVFDETVIHLGGEFSRSPRADMLGSDHSANGNAISLICGAIKKPCVIGNTQPSQGDSQHPGNYGIGDTLYIDGGQRQPSTGNQSSTLAHLLRVKAPKPNDSSMLLDASGGIVPTVELAKNKGES